MINGAQTGFLRMFPYEIGRFIWNQMTFSKVAPSMEEISFGLEKQSTKIECIFVSWLFCSHFVEVSLKQAIVKEMVWCEKVYNIFIYIYDIYIYTHTCFPIIVYSIKLSLLFAASLFIFGCFLTHPPTKTKQVHSSPPPIELCTI